MARWIRGTQVVRASAGAVFHTRLWRFGGMLERHLLCADAAGERGGRRGQEIPRDWVLALGSETGGLPAHLMHRAHAISVPMAAGADSLNVAVAGSILMHLLTRSGE